MSSQTGQVESGAVVVYQFKKGGSVPSISPFVIKLETYLRMADIKYVNNYDGKFSKKGKIPWISFDGQEIADSSFCIQYLNKKFNIDLDKHLDDTQKAIAHAYIKMMEENTLWATLVQERGIENLSWTLNEFGVPTLLKFPAKLAFGRKASSAMWKHGIGRHSQEEIHSIATDDIRACSSFLGNKQFFMGDKPSVIDAVMFGFFAEMAYAMPPGSWVTRLVTEDFKNLKDYCERMKEKYWPDWDSKLREATPK